MEIVAAAGDIVAEVEVVMTVAVEAVAVAVGIDCCQIENSLSFPSLAQVLCFCVLSRLW